MVTNLPLFSKHPDTSKPGLLRDEPTNYHLESVRRFQNVGVWRRMNDHALVLVAGATSDVETETEMFSVVDPLAGVRAALTRTD